MVFFGGSGGFGTVSVETSNDFLTVRIRVSYGKDWGFLTVRTAAVSGKVSVLLPVRIPVQGWVPERVGVPGEGLAETSAGSATYSSRARHLPPQQGARTSEGLLLSLSVALYRCSYLDLVFASKL